MEKRDILRLIAAFAVLGLIAGIIIVVIAKEGSGVHDAGMITVIVSFLSIAVCQIILWIMRGR